MTNSKMTQREFLTKVKEILENQGENALAAFAEERLNALDKRNKARSSKPTKIQLENENIKADIMALFESGNEIFVASDVGRKLEISTNKASALLRQLAIDDNKLTVSEVKIKGKGKVKGYSLKTE